MKYSHTLSKSDYLESQLYSISKSGRIKSQKNLNYFLVVLAMFGFTFLFYKIDEIILMYTGVVYTVLVLIFYPILLKKRDYNNYSNFVNENYNYRFEKPINITFYETHFEVLDFTGETKIYLSIIKEIIEVKKCFYLKMKTGGNLIIPKSKLENLENSQFFFISLSTSLKINYIKDLDWKW